MEFSGLTLHGEGGGQAGGVRGSKAQVKGRGSVGSGGVTPIPPHQEQHSEWLVKGFTSKTSFAAVQGPMSSPHSPRVPLVGQGNLELGW